MFNISINAKQSVPIPIRIPMIIKYKKTLRVFYRKDTRAPTITMHPY